MKLYMLPLMLVCFMAGMALDMTLSRVVIDVLFIAAMAGMVVTAALAMRYPRKKGIPRRKSRIVKSRKKSSGTSKSRLSGQAR